MKLGILIKDMGPNQITELAFDIGNNAMSHFNDVCLFFQTPGPKPKQNTFGIFDSSELHSFSGKLLTFEAESLDLALKSSNNIQIFHMFGLEKPNLIHLLSTLQHKNVSVLANVESKNFLEKKVNVKPIEYSFDNSDSLLKILK